MSKLLDAYFILGIQPTTALTAVHERYKWLASVYHPDRFTTTRKDRAELEMKRVNDARDTIKQHFAINHPNGGAQCHCFAIKFAPEDQVTASPPTSSTATAAGPEGFHSAQNESRRGDSQSAQQPYESESTNTQEQANSSDAAAGACHSEQSKDELQAHGYEPQSKGFTGDSSPIPTSGGTSFRLWAIALFLIWLGLKLGSGW